MDDAVDVHLVEDGLGLGRLDPVHVHLLTVVRCQHQRLVKCNRSAELKVSRSSSNFNIKIINVKLLNKFLHQLYFRDLKTIFQSSYPMDPMAASQAGMEVARQFMVVSIGSVGVRVSTDQVVWGGGSL